MHLNSMVESTVYWVHPPWTVRSPVQYSQGLLTSQGQASPFMLQTVFRTYWCTPAHEWSWPGLQSVMDHWPHEGSFSGSVRKSWKKACFYAALKKFLLYDMHQPKLRTLCYIGNLTKCWVSPPQSIHWYIGSPWKVDTLCQVPINLE